MTFGSIFVSALYRGNTINGRKLYTMPRIIAPGVLMIFKVGSPKKDSTELMTPVFSRSVCHARVRRRKFIHMGRMKIRTIKLCWLTCLPARIMARG